MKLTLFIVIVLGVLVLAALGGFGYFVYRKARFKTVKADQALIITGDKVGKEGDPGVFTENGRSVKVVRGGGHLVKMFQNYQIVDLTSFQLDLKIPLVHAEGGVPVKATATAQVAISDDITGIVTYAEQFSGKIKKGGDASIVEKELKEILEGNIRAVLTGMSVETIIKDRVEFNGQVVKEAQKQLSEMGFKLTSLVLKDIDDADEENPYIKNLSRALTAKVRKDAEIAEAENQRESRIHVAEQNKLAEEEELKRKAELDKVRKETSLQEQENHKQVELAKVQAEKAKDLEAVRLSKQVQEEQLALDASKKEEELRITQLEKERQVEIELKEAEVRKAKADADFYETTRRAEAEAQKATIDGKAQAEIEEARGKAEAESKKAKGLAEAQIILERGKAEAESKRLLAEAIAKHGEVVIIEKLIEMLPQYAKEIAAPLANIDSVKIMDMGDGNGVASYANSITRTMTQLQGPLKEMTGIDVAQMLQDITKRGIPQTMIVENAPELTKDSSNEVTEERSIISMQEQESLIDIEPPTPLAPYAPPAPPKE